MTLQRYTFDFPFKIEKTQSKMPRKNETIVTCPCCLAPVYKRDLDRTLGRKVSTWGMIRKIEFGDLAIGEYQWACDGCLQSGRAIIADPDKQRYCDFDPCLAYFDIRQVCPDCGEDFLFSKEEQKFWYEELRFWVQSKPKYCPDCRKMKRQQKNLNKELSDILSHKENLSIKDLERLSALYSAISRPDKAKHYQNLALKNKGKATGGPNLHAAN
ncbi:zinc-ribbon domain containing protein [Paraflavisolibacter sp. H34]|uniref:zinc-ribbon domain containing protein n=1 Tax=Huijunlia imazamoxiresistens TaxID=3127457 RepID=UPI00301A2709